MEKHKVYYCLDWLQATTDYVKGAETIVIDRVQKIFGDVKWETEGRAQRPYTNVVRCDYAELHWHPEHPEFKYMLRMTGQQLDKFRRSGGNVRDVMVQLEQYHFTMTRIDVARDIFGTIARPSVLYNKWRMGELRTTARKVTIIQSRSDEGSEGETVYFGGRTSSRYLRVYDKARQANFDGLWTRVEFELKRDNAEVAAHQILTLGLDRYFHSLLHSVILSGLPEWMKDGENVEIIALEAVPRKVTNTEKWLFDVVVPAMHKALAADVPGFRDIMEKMLSDDSLKHGASPS